MNGKPYCANIEITGKCNYRCAHCFDARNRENDMPLGVFKKIFKNLKKGGILFFNIIGGEPLLHKDWRTIVYYLNKAKVCFGISTNGSLLDENKVKHLKAGGVNYVKLSIDGPKKIHNTIRRNNQAFDNLLNATSLLKRFKIPFAFQMTLLDKNYKYVEDTCKIAEKLGASAIRINFYKNFTNPKNSKAVLRGNTLRKIIEKLESLSKASGKKSNFKIGFENSLIISGDSKSLCGAGTNKIQIRPNGNVYPCRYLPINLGNLRENKLSEILKHPFIKKLESMHKKVKNGCEKCINNTKCRGGCPAFIYYAYGNLSKKDPRCWQK